MVQMPVRLPALLQHPSQRTFEYIKCHLDLFVASVYGSLQNPIALYTEA